jgi:release factor glutamine methyltransferase
VTAVESVAATAAEAVAFAAQYLKNAGFSNALFESKQLVARCLGLAPARLDLHWARPWTPADEALLTVWLSQRASRVPLAYVLGEWDFLHLTLTVTPDVLIPRPETEELFSLAVSSIGDKVAAVADVGTGAGGLALAAAGRWPSARVVALDVSSSALAVARWNARRWGLVNQIQFVQNDLISGKTEFDLVLANLPYVATSELNGLDPELAWEPRVALDGGVDGLAVVRRCVPLAWHALRPGGQLWLEVGQGQGEPTRALLRQAGFREVTLCSDFAGIQRFVGGTR